MAVLAFIWFCIVFAYARLHIGSTKAGSVCGCDAKQWIPFQVIACWIQKWRGGSKWIDVDDVELSHVVSKLDIGFSLVYVDLDIIQFCIYFCIFRPYFCKSICKRVYVIDINISNTFYFLFIPYSTNSASTEQVADIDFPIHFLLISLKGKYGIVPVEFHSRIVENWRIRWNLVKIREFDFYISLFNYFQFIFGVIYFNVFQSLVIVFLINH